MPRGDWGQPSQVVGFLASTFQRRRNSEEQMDIGRAIPRDQAEGLQWGSGAFGDPNPDEESNARGLMYRGGVGLA